MSAFLMVCSAQCNDYINFNCKTTRNFLRICHVMIKFLGVLIELWLRHDRSFIGLPRVFLLVEPVSPLKISGLATESLTTSEYFLDIKNFSCIKF